VWHWAGFSSQFFGLAVSIIPPPLHLAHVLFGRWTVGWLLSGRISKGTAPFRFKAVSYMRDITKEVSDEMNNYNLN
jgi:hypothetical protein